MWRSLARKSHFVFGAKYTAERQNNDLVSLDLDVAALGSAGRREGAGLDRPDVLGESLEISWHRVTNSHVGGQHIASLDGKRSWVLPTSAAAGCWEVRTGLRSPHLSFTTSRFNTGRTRHR